MNPRREIEFPWNGETIRSRPTLARVAEIERKFGPAPVLARKCSNMELQVLSEQLPMLAIMLRGCDGVPKKDAELLEEAFEQGAAEFVAPMTFWLIAAYAVNEPQSKAPPEGN